MDKTIQLGNLKLTIAADAIRETEGHLFLTGSSVSITLPHPPVRYFRHGWQSWSFSAWTDTSPFPASRPAIFRPAQTDPVYATESLPHGSWFGAVEFADGNILLLGALGLETHVRLNGGQLEGRSEAGSVDWFVAFGDERLLFTRYAGLLGDIFGRTGKKDSPRLWCSWYSLYNVIDESLLSDVFDGLDDLPFDVLQVDDGWQVAIGDWEPNAGFPSGMRAISEKIRSTGRKAGLWLAPLIAARSSRLFREHPEWFLKDYRGHFVPASFAWSEYLHALDTTHPEALDWLAALMKQVRLWGFDYVKLDYLYAGALPGRRYKDVPRETAYRQALQVMRAALGDEAYLLACGAPILPSLGLCDALRIGPDVAGEWENYRDAVLFANPAIAGTRNAIRTSLHRLWLGHIIQVDPDVAYFASTGNSMSPKQKQYLQDLALICDYKAASDLPQWLSSQERETLRRFLQTKHEAVQTGRYAFRLDDRDLDLDFSGVVALPERARGLEALKGSLVSWLANQPWILRIYEKMWQGSLERMKRNLVGR